MGKAKVKVRVNKALAEKVGLNKYLPVSHYSTHATASSDRDFLVRHRKTLRSKDVKVCYEGKIGKSPVYSVLARTKRQMIMARRLLRKRRR